MLSYLSLQPWAVGDLVGMAFKFDEFLARHHDAARIGIVLVSHGVHHLVGVHAYAGHGERVAEKRQGGVAACGAGAKSLSCHLVQAMANAIQLALTNEFVPNRLGVLVRGLDCLDA